MAPFLNSSCSPPVCWWELENICGERHLSGTCCTPWLEDPICLFECLEALQPSTGNAWHLCIRLFLSGSGLGGFKADLYYNWRQKLVFLGEGWKTVRDTSGIHRRVGASWQKSECPLILGLCPTTQHRRDTLVCYLDSSSREESIAKVFNTQ